MNVLAVLSSGSATLDAADERALTVAHGLAAARGHELGAVVIGAAADPGLLELLGSRGVTVVHTLQHECLDTDASAALRATALAQVCRDGVGAVIGAASERSTEILAHLGAQLERPLATNCTDIHAVEGGWGLTRQRWGGALLETAVVTGEPVLFTTAGVPPPDEAVPARPVTTTSSTPELELERRTDIARVTERSVATSGMSLATAPVVVSGGRGVGSAEGFELLEELAALLGGVVGCSRVATNNGWRAHRDQVGQTGTRVTPALYIACGISGATQHWVGCMGAGRILAINTDPEAPMVARADDAVIGDLHEVLPAVVQEIRARHGG